VHHAVVGALDARAFAAGTGAHEAADGAHG
jgi:hypothetical protein